MKSASLHFRTSKGMTLMETLIAFSIFLTCTSVIIFFLPILPTFSDPIRQEIHMFFQQMKDDMDYAYDTKKEGNRFTIMTRDHSLQYRKSGDDIIRTKDGAGYEIVVQGVEKFQVRHTTYGAEVRLTDRHGTEWEAVLGFRPSMDRRYDDLWIREEP